ncbi:MAG: hypothetical protein ACM3ST_02490 [Bdellovibrio bacteriovorus]
MPIAARVSTSRIAVGRAWLAGLLLMLGHGGIAAEGRVIELRDGSVLQGELVGAGGGHYRIRTPVLGEIELPESEVLAIRSAEAAPPAPASTMATPSDLQGVMASIQQQMLGDPALASAITALQSDPELGAALADPAFTQLILSGNLAALGTDPRFLRLMANPAILAILGQIGGQIGGPVGGQIGGQIGAPTGGQPLAR